MSRPRYLWTSYFVFKAVLLYGVSLYALLHGLDVGPGPTVATLSLFIGAPLFALIETKCY